MLFYERVKSVTINKPLESSSFEMGTQLTLGGEKQEAVVTAIKVNIFNTVRVEFSNGLVLVFKGFPIVTEPYA